MTKIRHRIGRLKMKYPFPHDRDWGNTEKCKRCDLFMGKGSGRINIVCSPEKRVVITGVEL